MAKHTQPISAKAAGPTGKHRGSKGQAQATGKGRQHAQENHSRSSAAAVQSVAEASVSLAENSSKAEYNISPSLREQPENVDVKALRAAFGVTQPVLARMTGFSVRAIAQWERGTRFSDAGQQRMLEMQRLLEGLAGVMKTEYIATWLETPAPAFAGLKPLEVIERGQIDRIWRMIFLLESGTPV